MEREIPEGAGLGRESQNHPCWKHNPCTPPGITEMPAVRCPWHENEAKGLSPGHQEAAADPQVATTIPRWPPRHQHRLPSHGRAGPGSCFISSPGGTRSGGGRRPRRGSRNRTGDNAGQSGLGTEKSVQKHNGNRKKKGSGCFPWSQLHPGSCSQLGIETPTPTRAGGAVLLRCSTSCSS